MKQESYISSRQLFAMLIVFQLVIMMTADTVLLGGENLADNILSCGIGFAVNFVLILPLYFLNRRGPGTNILEKSYDLFGSFGAAVALFYVIYFIFLDCYYLSFFHMFTVNVLDPKIPSWLIAVSVVAVAVYAAFQRLEAIARTAVLVLVIILVSLLFMFATVTSRIDLNNLQPFLYQGTNQMWTGALQFLGRSACFSIMTMVLPQVSGKRKLGFVWWNFVIYGFMSLALFILASTLGNYGNTQLFPFYSLASVAGVGPFQRMDVIFIGVWISGIFLKIAMDLYLISRCFTQMFNQKVGKISIVCSAVVISAAAMLVVSMRWLYQLVFSLKLILPLTGVAAFLVPGILLLTDLIKHRKGNLHGAEQAVQKDSI
ncbi:MAG: GerAB/ArcD/ProY family transporter [Clostridiales bacterium]|nr:GerAB/ArcD/ProY family transporter [Clostridiales bacterium]